jgi:hypothetical protein
MVNSELRIQNLGRISANDEICVYYIFGELDIRHVRPGVSHADSGPLDGPPQASSREPLTCGPASA